MSLGLPCFTVDPPTFCLVAIFKVESKELELESIFCDFLRIFLKHLILGTSKRLDMAWNKCPFHWTSCVNWFPPVVFIKV